MIGCVAMRREGGDAARGRGRRGIVAEDPAHQAADHMTRGGGMCGDRIKHGAALLHIGPQRIDVAAEEDAGIQIMLT